MCSSRITWPNNSSSSIPCEGAAGLKAACSFSPPTSKVEICASQPAGHLRCEPHHHNPLQMEDETMNLELLLSEPKNEKHLDEFLGVAGVFDSYSHQIENQIDSLNVNGGEAAFNDLEIEDYIDRSMLGCFLPNGSLGHGRRGPRRASRAERVEITHSFWLQEPSTSEGRKHGGRKNNDHWTQDEVRQLVEGVSLYGVGKWSYVKKKYFLASIRTPVHLKDKWKNLVKSCKDNRRMLLPLEQSLIERILEIDGNDPYPKQSNIDQDCLAPISPDLPSRPPLAQWSAGKTRTKQGSNGAR